VATHLITPNEAVDGSSGDGSSVLLIGGHASRLLIANALIPQLFEEVNEGVRSLPRGGAEIGGLLIGPKGHEGGILADEIIPIPIEYRFGPSFRLSSPDLTKIEEAIATTHTDTAKTVVGFYRSRTRGGAELRDSDQEILLAVELAHAGFATDFLYYLVFSPPARSEMALGLAIRNGSDWSEFKPFTCHLTPSQITNDLGDPEPVVEEPAETEGLAPTAEIASVESHDVALEEVPAEELMPNAEPEAIVAQASEAEGSGAPSEESAQAETDERLEAANANAEHVRANVEISAEADAPAKKPTRPRKPRASKAETAAKPRAKKATGTGKTKTSKAAAAADGTAATAETKPHRESKAKASATAAALPEHKSADHKEPELTVEHLFKMRPAPRKFDWKSYTKKISRTHLLWAAGIIAAAALAAGGYLFLSKHAPAPANPIHPTAVVSMPATKQKLALSAERHGTDLLLSWNREAATVAHANYGMLIIRGKDTRRDIALTPDQLRAGSIVYTPTSDQVEVELSVVSGEEVTKDSVIVLMPRKGDKNAIVTPAGIQVSPQRPPGTLRAS
jgi:hypothetical protein